MNFQPMPNPTPMDLVDPVFNAIWKVTKTWDVNAPEYYAGYCGMSGSHVMLILDAIRASLPAAEEDARDAARYQRLRILGAAPCGTPQLERGTVLRFQSLDAFLDADIAAYPSRGEAAPAMSQDSKGEVK